MRNIVIAFVGGLLIVLMFVGTVEAMSNRDRCSAYGDCIAADAEFLGGLGIGLGVTMIIVIMFVVIGCLVADDVYGESYNPNNIFHKLVIKDKKHEKGVCGTTGKPYKYKFTSHCDAAASFLPEEWTKVVECSECGKKIGKSWKNKNEISR